MANPERGRTPEKKGRNLFHLIGSVALGVAAAVFLVGHAGILCGPGSKR